MTNEVVALSNDTIPRTQLVANLLKKFDIVNTKKQAQKSGSAADSQQSRNAYTVELWFGESK